MQQETGDIDANSLVVVNAGKRAQDLRRLSYTVESVDIEPDVRELNKAVAGTPADAAVTAAIPSDLPDPLIQLANRVTAKADTAATKGGRDPGLSPQRPVHLQHRATSRKRLRGDAELPASGSQGLLRAVRFCDGT